MCDGLALKALDFDSDLFGFRVGRIDVGDEYLWAKNADQAKATLRRELQAAYDSHDMKLVYIVAPLLPAQRDDVGSSSSSSSSNSSSKSSSSGGGFFPGIKVDVKTTYTASLASLDKGRLVTQAYTGTHARAVAHVAATPGDLESAPLRELAIASGEWSRFRTDSGVPRRVFEALFEAWLRNSLSRSIADEVFVALDSSSGAEVGFVTVQKRGAEVNVGLLSVAASHRRRGIASMLLSRAALWALEHVGCMPDAFLSIVTQGANLGACATYAHFGLSVASRQDVFHCWLPQHLVEPLSLVADQARVPFCRQHLTGNELTYVTQLLGGGGLDSAGRFSLMCAGRIHDALGHGPADTERVLMVPSGSAALEMAALLCNVEPGDEVIMPSYTFSSTANAFVLRGAVIVFVDLRPDTLNIDERLIEQAVTERTRAICCVHYGGVPCEMDAIVEIAQRWGLYVVEDAAQGFLSSYKGRALGSIGHFGCFSFHFTKNVICGEGGAIAVNRLPPPPRSTSTTPSQLAARALIVWEKGTNRYDFMAGKIDKYEWIDAGSSFVCNELACAVLWAQLERSAEITQARRANWALYLRLLAEHPRCTAAGLRVAAVPAHCQHNGHIFFVVLPSEQQRRAVAEGLRRSGISAMSHYVPLHSAPAGLRFGRVAPGSEGMTETAAVFAGLLRLPVWTGLSEEEIAMVVQALAELLENGENAD